ncbi:APC family permease [Aeromicrobium senzhongii]|uniref:APC family permease n=1 Tax=Aeromicrobium senzhongii TaxID=2663859 RepID=A0ABX6SR96_9ACTN|nr:APC family permease [Aeromicrobium senzhongii]MTB86902.1 amino acid permease [Aeromicrobium senzhongii]QNL93265.1 APC family permease [Aeromicrobium senzhongii]
MNRPSGVPALEEAIAHPPAVPQVRAESDLAGLDRRSVLPGDLLGLSVAVIAPAASALSVPFVLMRVVGPGAWLSAVLGFGLALLLAGVFSQFATRIAAAGSMYTWVTRSLGPFPGLLVGTSMLLGYGILVAFGVSQTIRRSTEAVSPTSPGQTAAGPWPQWWIGVAVLVFCLVVSIRGVRVATRLALVVESALVVGLSCLVVLTIGREGLPSPAVLSLEGADPWRIVLGATIVLGITVGFEASAALASEAERPFWSVPRAMTGSVLVAAALYVVSFLAASTLVPAPGHPRGPAQRWFPDTVDAHHADAVLSSLLAVSFLALTLCAWNALARVVFSFAREGILPAVLGYTHPRWASPVGALLVIAPFAIAPATVTLLVGREVGPLSTALLQSAVFVLFIAYALVALSLPAFLHRLDELTVGPVVLAATAVVLTLALASVDTVRDVRDGDPSGLVLAGVTLVFSMVWFGWLRSHRRRALRRMGIHDETIRTDLLGA